MGVINISSSDKDIELTSLEAHVRLCNQRQKSLENKITDLVTQNDIYKKMIFRVSLALVTCGLSGISALLIHLVGRI